MPTTWKVTSQKIDGEKIYAIYRLRDPNGVDHSGNREYVGGFETTDREVAEKMAEKMNALQQMNLLSSEH